MTQDTKERLVEEIVSGVYKRIEHDPLWENWLRQSLTQLEAATIEEVVRVAEGMKLEFDSSDPLVKKVFDSHNAALTDLITAIKRDTPTT
jgi:hypothetical protein